MLQRLQAQEPDDSCDEEKEFQLQDLKYCLQESDQNDSSDKKLEAENQQSLTSITVATGTTQNQQDSTNVTVVTSLLNDDYLKAGNGMTWKTIIGVEDRGKVSAANKDASLLTFIRFTFFDFTFKLTVKTFL